MYYTKKDLWLGLTGSIGSGCTTVAEYLGELDFRVYSLSSILKEKIRAEGNNNPSRAELQNFGNKLRKENGNDYLVQEIFRKIKEDANERSEEPNYDKIVFDSIRNPGEVAALRNLNTNFYLIAIDAPYGLRWKRSNFEPTFQMDDKRDAKEEIKHGQNVTKCVYLSDIIIQNTEQFDGSHAKEREFLDKVDHYLGIIENPRSIPPKYEESMMNAAYTASALSSCIQRKVGAIIATQEGEIIASGYNEVPRGLKPCQDEYDECFREKRKKEKLLSSLNKCPSCEQILTISITCPSCGNLDVEKHLYPFKEMEFCRALHAEERAMLQASKLGGKELYDTILYTTTFPCALCMKKIIHTGIRRILYVEPYPNEESISLFEQFNDTLKKDEQKGLKLKDKPIVIQKFEGVKSHAFHKLYGFS